MRMRVSYISNIGVEMMYSNKFVMCILVNGDIQKEKANGVVALPFNTEYQIRLRNKHNCRSVVQLYIDGENVSGGGYVIAANDHIDLKRHHDVDRAFKFVALDSPEAYDQGKNGPNEDGVKGTIEARFYLEKEWPKVTYTRQPYSWPTTNPWPVYPYQPYQPYWTTTTWGQSTGVSCWGQSTGGSSIGGGTCMGQSGTPNPNVCYGSNAPLQDGCTVEGSQTWQNFYSTFVDIEATYTSVRIFLQGCDRVISKSNIKYCDNCGTKARKNKSRFCHMCGTRL
jgi:hypothetical protein